MEAEPQYLMDDDAHQTYLNKNEHSNTYPTTGQMTSP